MKKNNTRNILVAMVCMAFNSHIVLAQTWNVKLVAPGKFDVKIKPSQIMENVYVFLLLTYQDNKTQEATLEFTDDQNKFLHPGNIYCKRFNCNNSVRSVEGRDCNFPAFDVAGGGDNQDRLRERLGPSSGTAPHGQPTIIMRERESETVLAVKPMSFQGWTVVPGGQLTDEAPAVCEIGNTIYLFSKGITDRGIYMNINSGTWTGRTLIPGMTTNTSLAAVYFAGRLFLFARSEDNHCFFTSSPTPVRNNSAWDGWQEVPGNIRLGVAIHASVVSNYLYLFSKNLDNNQISHNRHNSSAGWRGWVTSPANFTTNVSITSCPDPKQNKLWLFAKDPNNKIFYTALTVNSKGAVFWANWQPHPVQGSTVGALTATSDTTRIYLFARGTSNKVVHSQFSPYYDKWTNWKEISNERPTDRDIVITGRVLSRFTLFCKGITSNHIFMNRRYP